MGRRAQRAASQMTAELQRTAPVETGELRRETGVVVTDQTPQRITLEAKIDTSYAEYVTEGTRPHVITAKPGKVLAFYWPKIGETVFRKSVNHPGTQANPFFRRVIDRFGDFF